MNVQRQRRWTLLFESWWHLLVEFSKNDFQSVWNPLRKKQIEIKQTIFSTQSIAMQRNNTHNCNFPNFIFSPLFAYHMVSSLFLVFHSKYSTLRRNVNWMHFYRPLFAISKLTRSFPQKTPIHFDMISLTLDSKIANVLMYFFGFSIKLPRNVFSIDKRETFLHAPRIYQITLNQILFLRFFFLFYFSFNLWFDFKLIERFVRTYCLQNSMEAHINSPSKLLGKFGWMTLLQHSGSLTCTCLFWHVYKRETLISIRMPSNFKSVSIEQDSHLLGFEIWVLEKILEVFWFEK